MRDKPTRAASLYRRLFIFTPFLIALHLSAPAAFSATVVDDVGRSVEVPDRPARIISLAPSVTEILFALGLDEKVVGVTRYSDYPAEAASKERVGTYIRPNIEKIVSLDPDLVIAAAGGNPKEAVERLELLGLAVFTTFPKDIEGIFKTIRTIGSITGTAERAEVLAVRLEMEMAEIEASVGHLEKRRVFFQLGTAPLHTAGSGTFVDRLITMAGGINIAGAELTSYPAYSMEAVIMGRPEVILSAVMGLDRAELVEFWGKWKALPAVKKGDIYTVNPDVTNRPSPRIVEGLREIARAIHPGAFEKREVD